MEQGSLRAGGEGWMKGEDGQFFVQRVEIEMRIEVEMIH